MTRLSWALHSCWGLQAAHWRWRMLTPSSCDGARSVKEREQFGANLGAFQITQEKLARMLANIQASLACAPWHLLHCFCHQAVLLGDLSE